MTENEEIICKIMSRTPDGEDTRSKTLNLFCCEYKIWLGRDDSKKSILLSYQQTGQKCFKEEHLVPYDQLTVQICFKEEQLAQ